MRNHHAAARTGAPTARPKTAQGEALGIRQLSRAAPTGRRFEHLTLIPNGAPLGLGHGSATNPGLRPGLFQVAPLARQPVSLASDFIDTIYQEATSNVSP